jgi:hypothetical protein
MARRTLGKGTVLMLACLGWIASFTAQAQTGEARPDVRMVVDVSGSMKDNDPERLGASALELLASLLPDGVNAGVWTFGDRVDTPLPQGEVDDAWRDRALASSSALEDYQQFTDIEGALRQAAEGEAGANGLRHLVLLTDGVIDLPAADGDKPAQDAASRRRLVEELAPTFADSGVVVHAVAFSDQADLALVESLAQTTGGLSALAETPDGLLGAFLDIFERIFPADQVPLEAGRFVVDPDVEAFSALIFHDPDGEPLRLVAPDGSVYRADDHPDSLRWQEEPRFDLIRVPDPQQGEWRLEGEVGADSRVTVSSARTLRTGTLPATLYLGFPLPVEAWIEHEGAPLELATEDLEIDVELQDMEGEAQARVALSPEDGRFVGELPPPALTGNARLVIRAEGEDFHRQRIQAVNVLPAIGAVHRPRRQRVELMAEHPELDRGNTEIRGELQGETLEAEAVEDKRWRLALPELEEGVRLPLLLSARVTLDGQSREILLPRLLLNADARTALELANQAGPTLSSERLDDPAGESSAPDDGADELADRFVDWVNALPGQAAALWQEGWPGLERRVREHGRDPRLWLGMALVVLLLLVSVAVRRRRRRRVRVRRRHRRVTAREEPHV